MELKTHIRLYFSTNTHIKEEKYHNIFGYSKNIYYLCTRKPQGYLGRVARQRSAKPCTAVRIRQVPRRKSSRI